MVYFFLSFSISLRFLSMKLSAALSSMLTPAIRAANDFLLASTARVKEDVTMVLSWGAAVVTTVSMEPTSVTGV